MNWKGFTDDILRCPEMVEMVRVVKKIIRQVDCVNMLQQCENKSALMAAIGKERKLLQLWESFGPGTQVC